MPTPKGERKQNRSAETGVQNPEIIREERSSAVELTYVGRTLDVRRTTQEIRYFNEHSTFVGLSCVVAPPETMPSIITLAPPSLSLFLSRLACLNFCDF